MITIYVGNKPFKVKVIDSKEDMKIGLSNKDSLPKGEGLLFEFGNEGRVTMNMYEMSFPIDMIFMNKKGIVTKVASMEPGENDITVGDVAYVLEVNKGEGAQLEGDTIYAEKPNVVMSSKKVPNELKEKFERGGVFTMKEEDVPIDTSKMQVLDDEGTVLMNIKGGERIFSIKHTEDLFKLAKQVKDGKLEPEELGKLVKKIIHIQDTQEKEYVN